MLAGKGALAVAALAMLVLTACGGGEPRLMNVQSSGNGPDEFAILPPKALEMPKDLQTLPEPTLGGSNLTDPTPEADAVAALGGRLTTGAGIPAGDGALVNHAARYGRSASIRPDLAAEDLAFRSDNNGRILERLFNVNVYFKAYRRQSLNQQAELQRWRSRGARTVSAPPAQNGE
ncbi:Beta-barrel assembly machine subunit BamF [Pseudorhodobacter antarcticus]|jgi:hypothetical protein|uniref:Beta-barrel assembly machine subunit BamF n=1 Tax=Pseudorhodobacter antarcticus TaxID=1077947 RepID=A0A1H8FKT2_9RHOB|nr:DUF3035 domain-containing protein [Pseudorhodobacter antarcticus]SEN31698.1 Beta-barrel assembly machine subunit BamF [Pseudorhodobacter antarcticus]